MVAIIVLWRLSNHYLVSTRLNHPEWNGSGLKTDSPVWYFQLRPGHPYNICNLDVTFGYFLSNLGIEFYICKFVELVQGGNRRLWDQSDHVTDDMFRPTTKRNPVFLGDLIRAKFNLLLQFRLICGLTVGENKIASILDG